MKKVMVITWGSDGLGKACAEYFMKEYQVVVLSRSCEKIQILITNGSIERFECDITDPTIVKQSIKSIIEKYDRIDVLINNAWFWIEGSLVDCSDEDIKSTIDSNLLGQIYVTKYSIPHFKLSKGLIININSQSWLYKKSERSVYHASKWGMTWFGKSISDELKPEWIRVTNLHPGKIDTWFFEKQWIIKDRTISIQPHDLVVMINFIVTLDPKYSIPEFGIDNM